MVAQSVDPVRRVHHNGLVRQVRGDSDVALVVERADVRGEDRTEDGDVETDDATGVGEAV